VPRRKENELVEGLYPRINREPNNYNQSLASTSSSEKVYPQGFKSSSNFNPSNKESDTRNYASSVSSALSSDPSQCYSFPSVEEANSNFKENKLWDAKNLQNDSEAMAKEHEDNEIDFHDRRKCTYDRFMGTNLKLKDPESPSASVDPISHRVDQIMDDVDVGDEICWEDLIIGERIGLGNVNGLSDFVLELIMNSLLLSCFYISVCIHASVCEHAHSHTTCNMTYASR
jgi:hypothetical protein